MTEKITTDMITGKIIKIHKAGWGFISSREIPFTRIFFHWQGLRQDTLKFPELTTGMIVEFVPLEVPDKGYRAYHIKVVDRREKKDADTEERATVPILQERLQAFTGEDN